MKNVVKNRIDFWLAMDVTYGNPNGDPDADNRPRMDAESCIGLMSPECIKRKIRNFVQIIHDCVPPNDMYVREKAVLARSHVQAFNDLGIDLGEAVIINISPTLSDSLEAIELPNGIILSGEIDNPSLTFAPDLDKKAAADWLTDQDDLAKDIKDVIAKGTKQVKPRRPMGDEVEKGRAEMCKRFWDIRTFGAVMTITSAPNCGQVRGAVQINMARSYDPITIMDEALTRIAITTEKESADQHGDNHTIGRRFVVPYGLYRTTGFISPSFAEKSGFTEHDLNLMWEALGGTEHNMWDFDRSAARGDMGTRGLIAFIHDSPLGNYNASKLFDMIKVTSNKKPIREYNDYDISIPTQADMPNGVTLKVIVHP